AQTWTLPFDRSTASMLIFVVVNDPFDRFRLNRPAYEMPFGGGIHRISAPPSHAGAPQPTTHRRTGG
ncbi:hypothetical protein, partial [Methylorubrum sp. Q1]|uniref:hypothetical protein n=1 Tax=Methylorubrum sp. Q1 TaxID=2562453 RepID=UPI001AEE3E81